MLMYNLTLKYTTKTGLSSLDDEIKLDYIFFIIQRGTFFKM